MDPWLEAPWLWPGMHGKLIYQSLEALQPQLGKRGYYCDLGERVWVGTQGRSVYPDDAVFAVKPQGTRPSPHPTGNGSKPGARTADARGGTALLVADEPIVVERFDVEFRETFLDVYDAGGNQLVTGIEFLSPANKQTVQGRDLYRRKQRELREAGVNLVEIDLLRQGPFVLDVPEAVAESFRPWHYFVNLVRRGSTACEMYPIRLPEALPKIRIPLKPGEEDAVLDLQDVFNRSYDVVPYRSRVDYTKPPAVPLAEEDDRWADSVLRTHGLRPSA